MRAAGVEVVLDDCRLALALVVSTKELAHLDLCLLELVRADTRCLRSRHEIVRLALAFDTSVDVVPVRADRSRPRRDARPRPGPNQVVPAGGVGRCSPKLVRLVLVVAVGPSEG